ncbi:MAG: glycoside hydrolase family 31 protein [Gemmatimonadota bacterium]|nr:MAG: glycoside hydrolase family 31 protein [Gemmatimonadota bacterium]
MFYTIDGKKIPFIRAIRIHRRFQGFWADLVSADDTFGQLSVTMDAKQHICVELLPPPGKAEEITFDLTQDKNEHFYGLGDLWYTESIDLKGCKVEMLNRQGTPDECNYVPFFMSTKGYGIFVDSGYMGYFDFGTSDSSYIEINFPAPNLSMHIWIGNTMRDVLPQYLDLTGYPVLPPDWAFLPQKWRDEGTWDDVFQDVQGHRDHNIPLGVVWLDRPWMQGDYGSDDFIFDEERYPDAEHRIQQLHDLGVRVMVWGCDFLTPDSRYYQEALDNGYLVGGFGIQNDEQHLNRHLIDLANPEARVWFKSIIKNALNLGIDGMKLDRGQKYPMNVTPPSGRDPAEMHNYHSYLLVKTYAEALQEVRGKDFQFTPRAGWAGTQSWTMKWPGDLESDFSLDKGLPAIIRAQSAAGLTGFAFWGSDIGGYGNECTKTCFIRWAQQGTFSPLMQMVGKGNRWDAPFSWDEETVDIYRYFAKLRMNMIPYILEQARIAHEKGYPMVRHLAWEWPDDPEVHRRNYQYMFGDELLVACMISNATEREVYFPQGEWIDFWNRDRIIRGPRILMEAVPLAKFPVYIRKGASCAFELPNKSE